MKGVEKKVRKKLKEAKDLRKDLKNNKKLKKRYRINNVLIDATISLQTVLSEIGKDEAETILGEKHTTEREGFFCLVSDIGVRSIRTWTENGVYGVLLIGFLAQAMVSVTRFLCEPESSKATKFITDSMQKLTLTVERRNDDTTRRIFSNYNHLNVAILRTFGVIPDDNETR